jgi:hypothetical protein
MVNQECSETPFREAERELLTVARALYELPPVEGDLDLKELLSEQLVWMSNDALLALARVTPQGDMLACRLEQQLQMRLTQTAAQLYVLRHGTRSVSIH